MQNGFLKNKKGDFTYYTCNKINAPHMFTTKFGGVSTGHLKSMNLGFNRGDLRENVVNNYQICAKNFGIAFEDITATKQVHKDNVIVVTKSDVGMGLSKPFEWEADALITNIEGITLVGYYADCVVTLLYDEKSSCVGVCHSGWRGTATNILGKTVQKMHDEFGALPKNIICAIGPSIRQCCFETDFDVPDAMISEMGKTCEKFIIKNGQKYHVDLQGINIQNLENQGILQKNIVDSGICTCCQSDEFWSHRKTKGKRGVGAAFIRL